MAEIPGFLLRHTVDVDPFLGTGATGDLYAPTVPNVRCFRDDKRKLVRNNEGTEVVSETTLFLRLAQEPNLPPSSRVTLPNRVATVISCTRRDDGGLGAWQHLEVNLT